MDPSIYLDPERLLRPLEQRWGRLGRIVGDWMLLLVAVAVSVLALYGIIALGVLPISRLLRAMPGLSSAQGAISIAAQIVLDAIAVLLAIWLRGRWLDADRRLRFVELRLRGLEVGSRVLGVEDLPEALGGIRKRLELLEVEAQQRK